MRGWWDDRVLGYTTTVYTHTHRRVYVYVCIRLLVSTAWKGSYRSSRRRLVENERVGRRVGGVLEKVGWTMKIINSRRSSAGASSIDVLPCPPTAPLPVTFYLFTRNSSEIYRKPPSSFLFHFHISVFDNQEISIDFYQRRLDWHYFRIDHYIINNEFQRNIHHDVMVCFDGDRQGEKDGRRKLESRQRALCLSTRLGFAFKRLCIYI